ncbi:lebercilin [Esox lucius]|uniref:Lebercilin domain-containing protein n=1 Tax=Esox lucius TaxID=8010 RepID=A0A3P8XJL9_ESOLU|nr:lebercilin [Esox lucius]XP_010881404.1 lebercilin [Esox lucius]
MDLEDSPSPHKENRDRPSRQPRRSTGKPVRPQKRDESQGAEEKESCAGDWAKTRIQEPDPDKDRVSDGEPQGSSGSFYSEDYENLTPSERSLSPYSRTPSPGPCRAGPRAKRVSSSPFYKKGARRGVSRPPRVGAQPQRWGVRTGSQSLNKDKDSTVPPKDLDLVTKRMLSARLLKINELRNALAELQLRTDQLTKENRVLRQLQFRQERALQRYDDTDSEIAQLLSRHANETAALRERLRRAQERERVAERRLKDTQEQLQRSQSSLGRLRRLAEQQELGPREELTKSLEQERIKDQENQRRIKELERSLELISSSYQRQLASERKKTLSSQEQVTALQEEIARLSTKLKEKDRELDTRNIYANRMLKASPRNNTDLKRKGFSKTNSKAVQTENKTLSLDFPSPPPVITDPAPDDYLSLRTGVCKTTPTSREVDSTDQRQEETYEREEREKERLDRELNTHEEKTKRLGEGWEKQEEDKKRWSQKEEENRKRHGLVQQEVERRNQEVLASQESSEAERRRKEQLLAKLREIDRQSKPPQNAGLFSEVASDPPETGSAVRSPPRFSEPRTQKSSIFSFTEPGETGGVAGGMGSRDGVRSGHGGADSVLGPGPGTGTGRRGPRAQNSSEDLSFGSYAPSFGRPAPRGGTGFPPPPPPSALEALLGGAEGDKERGGLGMGAGKEKKSNLLKQLFGPPSSPSPPCCCPHEVLPSPPSLTSPCNRREGFFTFDPQLPTTPPAPLLSLHVTESRPAVRAIASFDEDIEELTL